MLKKIGNFSLIDGYYKNPSEEIIDLWLQLKGCITVHNGYFYAWKRGKQQGAWRDIDVLGVDRNQTYIVQVSTNIEDKMKSQVEYFDNAIEFLRRQPQYRWMVSSPREVRKKLVCVNPFSEKKKKTWKLRNQKIDLVSFDTVVRDIDNYLDKLLKESAADGRVDNAILHFHRKYNFSWDKKK